MNLALLRNTAPLADLDEAQPGRVAEIRQEQTYRSFVRMPSARLRATNDNLRTSLAMSML
jgi:hypothetical protein